MDYSKYYDEIEKLDNYSLSLKELFIKFLVYSNLYNIGQKWKNLKKLMN